MIKVECILDVFTISQGKFKKGNDQSLERRFQDRFIMSQIRKVADGKKTNANTGVRYQNATLFKDNERDHEKKI